MSTTCASINVTQIGVGTVSITSIPPGAEIFLALQGQPLVDQGLTTKSTGTTIPNLNPGAYDYKLTLTGYNDVSGTFTINPGQQTIVPTRTLTPVVAQAGFGTTGLLIIAGLAIGALLLSGRK